jgi:hypothetical protein
MPNKLPLSTGFLDVPGIFSNVETWAQFLVKMKAMPDSVMKRLTVSRAKKVIARKKRDTQHT